MSAGVGAPKHVASADMLADIMAKPLPRPLFVRLRALLHLEDLREQVARAKPEPQKHVETRAANSGDSRRG